MSKVDDVVHAENSDNNAAVLRLLRERLRCCGYSEVYASFNPLFPSIRKWEIGRKALDDYLGPLVDLFLIGRKVPEAAVHRSIGDLIEPLCKLGLLSRSQDATVFTSHLVLLPVFGHWLFCQKPQLNPTLYFGDCSIALLTRLRPKWNGRCLDLCAGPGIQALQCSLFARSVIAIEVNPIAAHLAKLNVMINDRQDIIQVRCGHLFDPLANEMFDSIVANPPFLPFPDDLLYPFIGHGGEDGLRITWKILDGLPQRLTSDGTAQVIGTCLSDGLLPECADPLSDWADSHNMTIRMSVSAHRLLAPNSALFEQFVKITALTAGEHISEVAERYQNWLTQKHCTFLCAYFLHIAHGSQGLHIMDVSDELGQGLMWYA